MKGLISNFRLENHIFGEEFPRTCKFIKILTDIDMGCFFNRTFNLLIVIVINCNKKLISFYI